MVEHTPGPWEWATNKTGELAALKNANGDFVISPRCEVGDYGLSCSEHIEVEPQDAALIAASHELLLMAYQYRSDLKFPPTADSLERRIEAIDALLKKVGAA